MWSGIRLTDSEYNILWVALLTVFDKNYFKINLKSTDPIKCLVQFP